MQAQVLKRLFSVDEFHRMAEAGVFGEDDRLELVDGEIVQMTPIGSRHAGCVMRLTEWFVQRAQATAIVSVQNGVVLDDRTELCPDLVLLRRRRGQVLLSRDDPARVAWVERTRDLYWDFQPVAHRHLAELLRG